MPPWEKLSTSLAENPARVNALRAQMLDARRKYGKIKVYEANTGVLRPLHPMFRKGAIPVEMKLAYDTPETIRELFTEYTRMLVENEPAFQTYLDLQDYAAELADLTKSTACRTGGSMLPGAMTGRSGASACGGWMTRPASSSGCMCARRTAGRASRGR